MPLYFSRASLRREPSAAGLAALFDPPGEAPSPDPQRRALWTLFADHADRQRDFLWRADRRGRFFILSHRRPEDRHRLFELETKPFEPALVPGDRLSFSLRANATLDRSGATSDRRVDVVMHALADVPKEERADRRMALANREGVAWLSRQGARCGFTVDAAQAEAYRTLSLGRRGSKQITLGVLDLDGRITVTDPDGLLAAIAGGFGRARAFGCGLMLIRRS